MASELAGACSGAPQSIGSRVWIADESTVDFVERAEDADRSTSLDEAPNCWRNAEPPCTVEARSFLKLDLTGSIAARNRPIRRERRDALWSSREGKTANQLDLINVRHLLGTAVTLGYLY